MRISKEKKETAYFYILRKIDESVPGIAAYAAENLEINKSTVHRYINEMLDAGIIEKTAHDRYNLTVKTFHYYFDRSAGDYDSDWTAYEKYIHPHIADLPANIINIWEYVVSEMTNNIIDHSGADKVKVTVSRDVLNTTVLLSDNGIGIFKKIKQHFGFKDIDDAIQELFKGKLTTDKENHSGEGIFFSSRLMDDFYIFSDGKIFTCNRFDKDRIEESGVEFSGGTSVYMKLSNTSKKQAIDVFNDYADDDGGFTRTSIPIKNVFDSSPISRSQAKRLCERLDSFKEVTLDFSSVEWIGQGFAHQLFRVFAGEHPDIKLIPVNMNDNVLKMYKHVRR